MKRFLLLTSVALLFSALSFGQGTVRGKITDENGETVIGARILLKSNPAIGTITDLDGNFSLKIPDTTTQILVISFIGHKTIEETIHPFFPVLIRNYTLEPDSKIIKEVEVSAKASKEKEYYVEKLKMNSAVTLDFISSETMKKTGDVNVTSAVARVAGVSTSSKGFITIRGIGDRYVKTSINGMRIPTLDPFTNNIKLDLIPSNLVDNIVITKTASPDLPGDWAGAYISIETKDYPEQLTISAESSAGYNSQSTFKNVLTSQGSSTDWLGYDNGFRNHNHNDFVSANINPSTYQQFVALGYGNYFNSLGVTEHTPWNETYYKLGLVQVGLLQPAKFNDADAVNQANLQYINGPYQAEAFKVLNNDASKSGKTFPDNWNTYFKTAPVNFSQSFSIGNQTTLFKKPLGFIFGFRYGSNIQYDPNAVANRLRSDGLLESSVKEQISKETNGWSALANLAYKFSPNHSISLMFMPNLIGVNNVRNSIDDRQVNQNIITRSQFYEQRRQLVYQFKSENYVPVLKLKTELNASYTNGNSSAPDFKNIQYWNDTYSHAYQIGGEIGDGIHRYYRYLSDNIFDSRLTAELPFMKKDGLERKIKFGGAYQRNDRKSDQYDYSLHFGSNLSLKNNDDLNALFAASNFDIRTDTNAYGTPQTKMDAYYVRDESPASHTFGKSEIAAGFLMFDYSIISRLRLTAGVRMEKASMLTDVVLFDSLGYAADDLRRNYQTGLPAAKPGIVDETNYLPSANLVYKIRQDEVMPVNLRLNFSQTIARPSLRELSDISSFDYEYRKFIYGNSDLKTVHINNYDLRVESYFKNGDNISLSFFNKDFKNHIELIQSIGYTWQNVDKSKVYGLEIEGKKALIKNFSFTANVTLVHSETRFVRTTVEISNGAKIYIPQDTLNRVMFGQAPYVVNGTLSYKSDTLGLTVALSYNVQGERLVITSDNKEIPDVYEMPRHLVDFKITKSVIKHFDASFKINDLLSAPVLRAYKNSDQTIYDRYTYGSYYVFSVIYKL